MSGKQICELPKNTRETIWFRLGEFKGYKFVDMRVFAIEDGKDPAPTKKGLAVSPQLWPQFRQALAQVEAAMIEQGWLDREDLVLGGGVHPQPAH
jgi:hypothetical protein